MKASFFKTPADFRIWFEKNHQKKPELLVGFYKTKTGKQSITWSQAVDEALCFGWIDGVRKSIDDESYTIRFTPRKPKSIWSAINIKKVHELMKQGKMQTAGLAAFEKMDETRSKIYSYEKPPVAFSPAFEKKFKANKKAWDFFQSLPASIKKPSVNWVMSAKQETTRVKRFNQLVEDSEAGRKIKLLSYGDKKNRNSNG
jgi:uncharacterized protein YdeI (YjbR/CyaY-like superfamily)